MRFSSAIVVAAAGQLVAGHGAIVKAVGDQGCMGMAIGVVPTTPRDDATRKVGQQDSTRFKNEAADSCGETLGGGTNDPATQVPAMLAAGVQPPMVSAGGQIMMTIHQVNGDGAGPYTCMMNSTGTGTGTWQQIQVTQNVPGENSCSKAKSTDFPLAATIPASMACTGTMAGMVRCNNAANAGPFGGCVPVQMVGAETAQLLLLLLQRPE